MKQNIGDIEKKQPPLQESFICKTQDIGTNMFSPSPCCFLYKQFHFSFQPQLLRAKL